MRTFRFILPLLTIGLLPSLGLAPRVAAGDLSPQDLYDKVVRSCVYIITPIKGVGISQGSGSLIDAEQKLVLTNYHVVDKEDQVYCQFPVYVKGELMNDKENYKERWSQGLAITGKVLFRDKSRDLAVVKLESIPIGTEAIPLAKVSTKLGTEVWQIGNAGAVKQVFRVSRGEVSAVKREKFKVGGGGEVFEVNAWMVTSTVPANPGDSGGPLFDKRGYQVAVTESGDTRASLVSMFVDIKEVRALLEEKKITIKELSNEPDPTPAKKGSVKKGPPKADAKVEPVDDEKVAAERLRSAKLFAGSEADRETYVAKLREIVMKWPNTEAGKEAKKLLDKLK